jgi:hypothetical protein
MLQGQRAVANSIGEVDSDIIRGWGQGDELESGVKRQGKELESGVGVFSA